MTAHVFEDEREACLEAGMDDFLSKPISVSAMRSAIDRWAGPPAAGPVEEHLES